jgi:arylsulfatase A-like enzyme
LLALVGDLYDAEIATLDEAIGELVETLRTDGILDETLVIVAGDHGEALGEHHLAGHAFGMSEVLLRVPLLIRLPGGRKGGTVVDDVVRLVDILPTCLEVCGVDVPPDLDGRSLLSDPGGRVARGALGSPLGLDRMREDFPDADVDSHTAPIRSAFDGRFHYLRHGNGREELYDLRVDRGETRNLVGDHPDVVSRLRSIAGGFGPGSAEGK